MSTLSPDAEWQLLVAQMGGSDTSSDEQAVNKYLQKYKADLASAQADLNLLK